MIRNARTGPTIAKVYICHTHSPDFLIQGTIQSRLCQRSTSNMPTFAAKPLHPTTIPSNLSIISPVLTTSKTAIGNGGTSTRTADIVECVNNYHMAPSGLPGRAIMSSSRNTPREMKREIVSGKEMGVVLIDMLER
jgi:hypothetical protein